MSPEQLVAVKAYLTGLQSRIIEGLAALEKLYRVHRTELRSIGPRLISLLERAASPEAQR